MTSLDAFFGKLIEEDNLKCGIYGEEVGMAGTPHLQIFFELCNKTTLSWVRNKFPWCHVESRKGTIYQAYQYCLKDGKFKSFGTPPDPTYREARDLKSTKALQTLSHCLEDIKAKPWVDLLMRDLDFQLWAARNMGLYREALRSARDKTLSLIRPNLQVIVYYGPTGTGKTHRALSQAKSKYPLEEYIPIYTWRSETGVKWFESYRGQKVIILDDFSDTSIGIHELKRILDKYPLIVEVKGSSVPALWETVYITSNHDPDTWYLNEKPEDRTAIFRRITASEHLIEPYEP